MGIFYIMAMRGGGEEGEESKEQRGKDKMYLFVNLILAQLGLFCFVLLLLQNDVFAAPPRWARMQD